MAIRQKKREDKGEGVREKKGERESKKNEGIKNEGKKISAILGMECIIQ